MFLEIKVLSQRTALFVFLKSIKSIDFCRLRTKVPTEKIIPFRKMMILQRYIHWTSAKKTAEHDYSISRDRLACLQHRLLWANRTKPSKQQNPLPRTFEDSLHVFLTAIVIQHLGDPEVFEVSL